MSAPEWYHGVPWIREVLEAAKAEGVADAVTEVARGLIEVARHDPTRSRARRSVRGRFTAVITDELVVCGYEIVGDTHSEEHAEEERKGHWRGPKDQDELIEWLADEGYATVPTRGGHLAVLSPQGGRVMTMGATPSDYRTLDNNVSVCRRVLGIELRRRV